MPGIEEELLMREVGAMLKDEHTFQRFHAARNQAAVAKALGENRKSVDGLGAPVAEIHPDVYHYWGQKLGYKCWKDKGFIAWLHREFPETRVKATGTRIQSGYTGHGDSTAVKFRKTYANG
jgi:hypothetical protein